MILQGVPSNLDFTGIPVDLISDPDNMDLKHNPDNLQVYRYDCGNKTPK